MLGPNEMILAGDFKTPSGYTKFCEWETLVPGDFVRDQPDHFYFRRIESPSPAPAPTADAYCHHEEVRALGAKGVKCESCGILFDTSSDWSRYRRDQVIYTVGMPTYSALLSRLSSLEQNEKTALADSKMALAAVRSIAQENKDLQSRLSSLEGARETDFKAGYEAGYDDGGDRADTFASKRAFDPDRAWEIHKASAEAAGASAKEGE